MLFILSFAIAGKLAGSILGTQGYSQGQIFPASYSRKADRESLRQTATRLGTYGFALEPSKAA